MLTDDKALVERLRLWGEHGLTNTLSDLVEAADRIEAQAAEIEALKTLLAATAQVTASHFKTAKERAAEIERLRAALVQIARLRTDLSGDFSLGSYQSDIARVALGETE